MLGFDVVIPLYVATNVLLIVVSSLFGGALYWVLVGGGLGDIGAHLGVGVTASAIYTPISHIIGLNKFENLLRGDRSRSRILVAWVSTILVLIVSLFLLKIGAQVSRGSMVFFAVFGWVGLVVWRGLARRALGIALANGMISGKYAIVLGTEDELSSVEPAELLTTFGITEGERFVLPRQDLVAAETRGTIRNVLDKAREAAADEIVLAIPWGSEEQLQGIIEQLRASPLSVKLLPDRAVSTVVGAHSGAALQTMVVDVKRAPLTRIELLAKRALDVSVATLSLLVLAPTIAVAALAIKLESPGPIIFRQRRRGFNGREFLIHKFRTMRVLEDGAAFVQAKRQDPRVTKVGAFLRRTSIDELPQLIDVLKGQMSIVGPRPHPIALDDEYEKLIANYAFRHHVKPGITGWAQVNGHRGETPGVEIMAMRVHHDLWYVDNWSLLLDVKIIVRTFFELARTHNAY
ncbi:undecaprenyl-phosphate glucose phosphotransferase [Rhodoplanes roseus]|nr:undecaprenyl-phosphate glucose phosphotransferase [Rhodoplanes roseus]